MLVFFICMLFVYIHIKCIAVPNTSNFDKDIRRHMTNMSVLATKENMGHGDAG